MCKKKHIFGYIWSLASDLTRPKTTQKVAFRKGNPLISGKSRLVRYYILARYIDYMKFISQFETTNRSACFFFGRPIRTNNSENSTSSPRKRNLVDESSNGKSDSGVARKKEGHSHKNGFLS